MSDESSLAVIHNIINEQNNAIERTRNTKTTGALEKEKEAQATLQHFFQTIYTKLSEKGCVH